MGDGEQETPARPASRRRPDTRLLKRTGRASLREVLVVLAVLLAASAACFGPHVADGGFYGDDWNNFGIYTYQSGPGFSETLDRSAELNAYRPVLVPYVPLTVKVFEDDAPLFIAWSLVLACLMSGALFVLLRTLGMGRLDAGAISLLVLLCPLSGSTGSIRPRATRRSRSPPTSSA